MAIDQNQVMHNRITARVIRKRTITNITTALYRILFVLLFGVGVYYVLEFFEYLP